MESDDSRVRDALASHADDFAVVGELHDVPPYRVYEVRFDGRRAVLKLDDHPRGHATVEGRVQAYVAERTSIPVPAVVDVGDGYFVAAWSDDAARAAETVDEEWARAVGAALATLHAETAGEFDAFGPPCTADGRDAWIAAVRGRLDYHRSYLDGVGHAAVADAVEEFFRDHPCAFDGAGEPVLCHGNVLPEHAPVAASEVASLIDFEHALVAPGEYDYWRTALPAFGGRDDLDDAISRAFRDGYESVRSLPSGFERRRKLYWLVNFVSYFESLYLQKNVGPAERADRAERMREIVLDTLEELRGRRG